MLTTLVTERRKMSKRTRSTKLYTVKRIVSLPLEVWQMIMDCLDARSDSSTVLTFALVCKAGRNVVAPSIARWVAELDAVWRDRRQATGVPVHIPDDAMYKRQSTQLNTLVDYCRYWSIALNLPRPETVTTAKTEEDIQFALYYASHIASLERDWRVDKPDDDAGLPFHTKLHLTGIQLRDAFYYDATEQIYKPLKKKAGLQTVEMKATRPELLDLVHQRIHQRLPVDSEPDNSVIARWAIDGLDQVKDLIKLRVTAYNLLKKDLVMHKPRSKALLRDAVLDGHHLFDSENHAARTLYCNICVFRRRNLSRNQQLKVLRLAKGRGQRAHAIAARLGSVPKGPQVIRRSTVVHKVVPSMVIDDSEDDSEYDSDIDDGGYHEVHTYTEADDWQILFRNS